MVSDSSMTITVQKFKNEKYKNHISHLKFRTLLVLLFTHSLSLLLVVKLTLWPLNLMSLTDFVCCFIRFRYIFLCIWSRTNWKMNETEENYHHAERIHKFNILTSNRSQNFILHTHKNGIFFPFFASFDFDGMWWRSRLKVCDLNLMHGQSDGEWDRKMSLSPTTATQFIPMSRYVVIGVDLFSFIRL